MNTEERRLVIRYLNNVLKGPLSPRLQEDLWGWAEANSLEVFRLNLEGLLEQALDTINARSRLSCEGRIREEKIRLLKKTAAKYPACSGRAGRIGALSEKIAETFRLKGPEREILQLSVGGLHLPALDSLIIHVGARSCGYMNRKNFPALSRLLGLSAGEIERAFSQNSPLLINGLFSIDGQGDINITDPLHKMVNQPRRAGQDIKSLVLEKKARPTLTKGDFEHLAHDYDYLVKLLSRGLKEGARGLNILLYGPPGTGKTELAKTLAAEAGADLYPVSETSAESNPLARLAELQMARPLVSGDPKAMLLMDEAEDVLGDSGSGSIFGDSGSVNILGHLGAGGYKKHSKLFLNRMLEKNERPVIWISNRISQFDPAYLRRFSYALEVKTPPVPARARIWRNELARKKIRLTEKEIGRLAKNYELPPSYAVSAIRAAKLVRDKGAIERTLESLEYAVTGRPKLILEDKKADFNPALLNTDTDLAKLTERVLSGRLKGFSLCLFGAPGTGKSEYARHLAERMGLEVLHARASDLFSKFVGGSEKNIAAAFREARKERKFLIFDEADSLLRERGRAEHSWEVTQVNEMLTWMESHPYPFACTTNLMDRLDQASLRRFTFKVKYDYLTRAQARLAFRHFFGLDFEVRLEALTPGDFAVAARKAAIMGLSEPAELAELLAREQEAKGVKSAGLGFLS